MTSLLLTSASQIGYLEYPSVHHKESLVVGVFGKTHTLFNDLVYKVGRLDKGKLLVRWCNCKKDCKDCKKDVEYTYTEGHYPSVALFRTHIEGEAEHKYCVVETHQSQVYKNCYYRIGEVNEDLLTIDFGPDIKLCRGVNPKVCAKDDCTVIIISEKPYSSDIIQYSIGQVNVKAKTIEWHGDELRCKEFKELSGTCPSVSISKDNVVVACVNSSKLTFIVGNLRPGHQEIAWGDVVNRGVGTNPSISVNSHGHVVEVHANGYARRLFYSIGECHGEERKIVWNNDFCDREYTLGRSPSISLADDGYVIESHRTNCGYQSYLSPGQLRRISVDVPDEQVDAPDKFEIEGGAIVTH